MVQMDYPELMKYSITLRLVRLARGLSQRDVAHRLGLKDPGLISRWENGFSFPDLRSALDLSDIYGITVNELFQHIPRRTRSLSDQDDRDRVEEYEQPRPQGE